MAEETDATACVREGDRRRIQSCLPGCLTLSPELSVRPLWFATEEGSGKEAPALK